MGYLKCKSIPPSKSLQLLGLMQFLSLARLVTRNDCQFSYEQEGLRKMLVFIIKCLKPVMNWIMIGIRKSLVDFFHVMRPIVLSMLFLSSFSGGIYAETINSTCVSPSQKSSYRVSINTNENKGRLRYQFDGQDIFYRVVLTNYADSLIDERGNPIVGVATYESNIGRLRAPPTSFQFEYDRTNNTLNDNGMTYSCSQ